MVAPMRKFRGLLALLVVGISLTGFMGGCGFSDTLTSRGFIKEGDQICIDSLVRTGVALQPGLGIDRFLAALSTAYRNAARGFAQLDLREDDDPFRDRVVGVFGSASRRFEDASRRAVAGNGAEAATAPIFADVTALEKDMKAYGFDVCGGGGAAPGRPRT
jgi:hypothetical protein